VLNSLKLELGTHFKIKNLGRARTCVGINITYVNNGMAIDQSSYIKNILMRFGIEHANPVPTPSVPNEKLMINMKREREDTDNILYQEAVECLFYLVQGTRPDIAFAVGNVSRFNSNHGQVHWTAVKRIFRYLKGTINYSIFFSCSNDLELHGFADADWDSDVNSRSCTGYVFMMGTGSVSWLSKRQPMIALSSTKAKYMAMAMATQEVVWLKQFHEQFEKVGAIRLKCDNQSALNIAATDYFRASTKPY